MGDIADIRKPRFCHHCGEALPPGEPRFCIACGGDVAAHSELPPSAPLPSQRARAAATGRARAPTVRLGNAGVEQSVIGGTVQLPSSGAIPPGLWVLDEPPGPKDVVAVYAPLRAVVGGWSGLIGKGWQREGSQKQPDGRAIFRFSAEIAWFPASGCGGGLQLQLRIGAESQGAEGRTRRGFRYFAHHDTPMTLLEARWVRPGGAPSPERPLPQIQIMAPPRVPRMSDYDEPVVELGAAEAEQWAHGSQAAGLYQLQRGGAEPTQEQTPVGRGLGLVPIGVLAAGLRGLLPRGVLRPVADQLYRIRLERPYTCELATWAGQLAGIRAEARALGLDMEAEPSAEWWLDRNGYDGVIFTRARPRYQSARLVLVFRRAQIVRVRD